MKLCVSLIGKTHGLFATPWSECEEGSSNHKAGFAQHVAEGQWSALEQAELTVIEGQLASMHRSIKQLEKDITAFAKMLPGYGNIISI